MALIKQIQEGNWDSSWVWDRPLPFSPDDNDARPPGHDDIAVISLALLLTSVRAAQDTRIDRDGELTFARDGYGLGARLYSDLFNAGTVFIDTFASSQLTGYSSASGRLQLGAFSTFTITNDFRNAGSVDLANGSTLVLPVHRPTREIAGGFSLRADRDLTSLIFGQSTDFWGAITMSDSSGNVVTAGAARRRLANTGTISGAGRLGGGIMSLANLYAGVIRATGTMNALVIDTGPQGTLTNDNLIEAAGKAGLVIEVADFATRDGKVENRGTLRAIDDSSLRIAYVDVLNAGIRADKPAVIEAKDNARLVLDHVDIKSTHGNILASGLGSSIELKDSRIEGGSLELKGTDSALVVSGRNVLRGVALNSAGTVTVAASALLNVSGATGPYVIAGATVAGNLLFDRDVVLKGSGNVSVTGRLLVSSPTLTNVDEQISGTGLIQAGSLVNQAAGTIVGSLDLDVADELTNAGTIVAGRIGAFSVHNTGTIAHVTFIVSASEPDALILNDVVGIISGSTFGHSLVENAGLVQANVAGQVTSFSGTTLHGGTLASNNGSVIAIEASPYTTLLHPDKIVAGTTIVVENGATVDIDGPALLDRVTLSLSGANRPTTLSLLRPSVTLQGGTIALSDSSNNRLLFRRLTNAAGTISGAGEIVETAPGTHSLLTNQAGALIEAAGSDDLTIDVDRMVNDGVLRADNCTLTIRLDGVLQGDGEALVANGGMIDLSEVRQYLGTLRYAGRGTILGPDVAPTGKIFGFGVGDTYVFGNTNGLSGTLSTVWRENVLGTGGTLTVLKADGRTYASLGLAGSYTSEDFAATQLALADGSHVAVSFVGALRWAAAVDGTWQDAARWMPGEKVPGISDRAQITAVDEIDPSKTYTVTVSQDTTVESLTTGNNATLQIKAGKFTALKGTHNAPNAGLVSVGRGALFTAGGTFTQFASGRIAAEGNGTTLAIANGGEIAGGHIALGHLASLAPVNGAHAALKGVALSIDDNATVTVRDGTLTLADSDVTSAPTGALVANGAKATLMLADTDVTGGRVDIDGAATMQVVGTVDLDTKARLEHGRILSKGAPATLRNCGLISGTDAVIGDTGLSLVNRGSITTALQSGAEMSIDTGANRILNDGTIQASLAGTALTIASMLLNRARGRLLSGLGVVSTGDLRNLNEIRATGSGSIEIAGDLLNGTEATVVAQAGGRIGILGDVTNRGTMRATAGGTLELSGSLTNHDLIRANAGGTVTADIWRNNDRLQATGAGSLLDLTFAPAGRNLGEIAASDHGKVVVHGNLINRENASLLARDGGEVQVLGAIRGGVSRISGDAAVIDLEGSATVDTTTRVSFVDNGVGHLVLDHSSRFAGTVAGFGGSDTIDVRDVRFVAGASFYDEALGQLVVSDGHHNAAIQLLGQHAAADFAFTSDRHGGTLIIGLASAAMTAGAPSLLAANS